MSVSLRTHKCDDDYLCQCSATFGALVARVGVFKGVLFKNCLRAVTEHIWTAPVENVSKDLILCSQVDHSCPIDHPNFGLYGVVQEDITCIMILIRIRVLGGLRRPEKLNS